MLVSVASLPQGNYTVKTLAVELTESLKSYNSNGVKIETNKPNSVLKITRMEPKQNSNKDILVGHALAGLIGIGRKLDVMSYIKRLNRPSTVQPKKNAHTITSFCVRKPATSCGFLRVACAWILRDARTSLR